MVLYLGDVEYDSNPQYLWRVVSFSERCQEWSKCDPKANQTLARTHAKVKSIHKHGPITYIDKKTAYPVSISYQASEQ